MTDATSLGMYQAMYKEDDERINSFWSMEPLLGPVDIEKADGFPKWVICKFADCLGRM